MANYYFVIVGHNDNPLFELEYPPKSAESTKVRAHAMMQLLYQQARPNQHGNSPPYSPMTRDI